MDPEIEAWWRSLKHQWALPPSARQRGDHPPVGGVLRPRKQQCFHIRPFEDRRPTRCTSAWGRGTGDLPLPFLLYTRPRRWYAFMHSPGLPWSESSGSLALVIDLRTYGTFALNWSRFLAAIVALARWRYLSTSERVAANFGTLQFAHAGWSMGSNGRKSGTNLSLRSRPSLLAIASIRVADRISSGTGSTLCLTALTVCRRRLLYRSRSALCSRPLFETRRFRRTSCPDHAAP